MTEKAVDMRPLPLAYIKRSIKRSHAGQTKETEAVSSLALSAEKH